MNQSDITHFERGDWEEHFKQLCYGALQYRSKQKGRIRFPGCHSLYGDKYDSFSTLARILPILGCWLHNPENPVIVTYKGIEMNIEAMFMDAFLSGTDENSEDYWGKMYDRISKIVEVNDLIWAIWLVKDTTLKKFSKNQLDQVIAWIDQIYHKVIWDNNWRLTPILVHLVKRSLGYEDNYDITEDIASIEKMYQGDGWYSDSTGIPTFDYYNAWQLHFGTMIMVLTGSDILGKEKCDTYIARTKEFLESFPYFFGQNGSHIPFGRSLAYKYAILGTMMLARYLGISPLSPGLERRIASGNLRYFLKNHSVNENHFLECGFLEEPEEKYEVYMFYGSPYWCSRGLLCLMYNKNDAFWTAKEELLPVERGDFIHRIPACGFTLIGDQTSGHVQLLSSKNFSQLLKRSEPFYSKFSYSSHMHFDYRFQKGMFPRDGVIYCSDQDGDYYRIKEIPRGENEENYIYREMVQGKDRCKDVVKIKSYVIQSGIYQIRLHELDIPKDGYLVHEGTYAMEWTDSVQQEQGTDWSYASTEREAIYQKVIYGYQDIKFTVSENFNLVYKNSMYIEANTSALKEGQYYVASICVGQPARLSLEDIQWDLPQVKWDETEKTFTVTHHDKTKIFSFTR